MYSSQAHMEYPPPRCTIKHTLTNLKEYNHTKYVIDHNGNKLKVNGRKLDRNSQVSEN